MEVVLLWASMLAGLCDPPACPQPADQMGLFAELMLNGKAAEGKALLGLLLGVIMGRHAREQTASCLKPQLAALLIIKKVAHGFARSTQMSQRGRCQRRQDAQHQAVPQLCIGKTELLVCSSRLVEGSCGHRCCSFHRIVTQELRGSLHAAAQMMKA